MSTTRLGMRLREIVRGAPPPPPSRTPRDVDATGDSTAAVVGPGSEAADERSSFSGSPDVHPPAAADTGDLVTPLTCGQRLARAAARALGGEILDTAAGPCVVIDRVYPCDHHHGRLCVGECAEHVHPAAPGLAILAGTAPGGSAAGGDASHAATRPASGDILFVDLETTGLAGGAGTYAFLVGCAWFEAGTFRVRQFVMLGHALERAVLAAVRERFASCAALVTYNGKTFDVPVLETRYLFNRQTPPFGALPHVDMLHSARRLWRGVRPVVPVPGAQTDSCALGSLEQVLFGVRRTGDVPAFEIPTRYFAFLRSEEAAPLRPVLEHNRLDLISLAALTASALRLLDGTADAAERPRECVGLGRLFERAGLWARAEACYARAVALAARSWQADDELSAIEASRALALGCRRKRRYVDAAAHWEAVARARRCPPGLRREALEALAIHHEHRSRDLEQARRFAEQTRGLSYTPGRHAAVDLRLARIDRKMGQGGGRAATASLWGAP